MPIYLWLLLGGVTAYLVVQGGKQAQQAPVPAAPGTLSIQAYDGNVYSMPIDGGMPSAVIADIQKFWRTFETSGTVADYSKKLATEGYSIAAGGIQSIYQLIGTGGAGQSTSASDGGGGGGVFNVPMNPFHSSSLPEEHQAPVVTVTEPSFQTAPVAPVMKPMI